MKRILLIEENQHQQKEMQNLLQLSGYEIRTVQSTPKGIDEIKSNPPDLILCGESENNAQTFSLLHLLNQHDQTAVIPFILLSTKQDRKSRRSAMEAGADDYVVRPYKEIDLLNTIERRLLKYNATRSTQSFDQSLQLYKRSYELFPLELFREDLTKVVYEKDEYIFHANELPASIFFVKSGCIKEFQFSLNGKEFIHEIYRERDYFGLEAVLEDRPYESHASAIERSEVYHLPKNDLEELLLHNRDAASNTIKYFSTRLSHLRQKNVQLAYSSVKRRLVIALLEITQDSDLQEIHLSRTQLASMVGTTVETVVRELRKLREDKLIQTADDHIQIMDRKQLKDIAFLS